MHGFYCHPTLVIYESNEEGGQTPSSALHHATKNPLIVNNWVIACRISVVPKLSIMVICLLLLLPHQAALATSLDMTSFRRDWDDLIQMGADLVQVPRYFESKQWICTGAAVTTTVLLFGVDAEVRALAQRNQGHVGNTVFRIDSFAGNQYSLITPLVLYASGVGLDRSEWRETGLQATAAFIYSGSVTNLLKAVIARERPYGTGDPLSFKPLGGLNNDNLSLPSGHTTVAMATATVLAAHAQHGIWKAAWMTSGILVGAARIYHDRHWLSDTFLGAMIGYHIGRFCVSRAGSSNSQIGSSAMILSPTLNGLMITWNW